MKNILFSYYGSQWLILRWTIPLINAIKSNSNTIFKKVLNALETLVASNQKDVGSIYTKPRSPCPSNLRLLYTDCSSFRKRQLSEDLSTHKNEEVHLQNHYDLDNFQLWYLLLNRLLKIKASTGSPQVNIITLTTVCGRLTENRWKMS